MTDGTLASRRLLDPSVWTATLDPDEVGVGHPAESSRPLGQVGATEVGIWEIEPGTTTDVEVDEVFVVIEGSGFVTFEDGSSLALTPGTAVSLKEGDRTTWTIRERLRKLYIS